MIGTVAVIGTLKMVMIKIGPLTEMVVHEAAIGTEVVGQHVMREEVTGVGRVLMTALTGEGDHLLSTATSLL